MTTKSIVLSVAFVLGATPAAFAQSAYTTGTAESSATAGYNAPYGGAVIYNYVPSYGQVHAIHRNWRQR